MKKIIFPLIAFIVFVFIIRLLPDENKLCEYYAEDKFYSISGIVNKVFIDKKNHSSKKVIVKSKNQVKIFFLDMDKTGLFDYLQPNDSIFKDKNTYEVLIFRDGEKVVFTLDYGCEN